MPISQTDIKTLRRRLRRKGFGRTLAGLLLFAKKDADGKPCSPLAKSYANMYHCQDQMVVQDGVLSAPFHCNHRGCPECNRIRTAVLIDAYLPRFEEEQRKGHKLYFVTLTRRNVKPEELKKELVSYHETWSKMTDMAAYRNFITPERAVTAHERRAAKAREKAELWQNRGFLNPKTQERVQHFLEVEKEELQKAEEYRSKYPIIGIRKLECTYHHKRFITCVENGIVQYKRDARGNRIPDPYFDTYHPHFHILCNSLEFAEWLKATWLELCGDRADEKAQDIREVYDNDTPKEEKKGKKGLKEIFKYFTKLVSKNVVPGRSPKHESWFIYADALDNIFTAMSGRRVFQRFGQDEVWQCEEIDEENIEEHSVIEGMDNDVFEFLETGMWGDGEWTMVSRQTGDVLVSVERKGRLCSMLRYAEETANIDRNLLEEVVNAPPDS